MLPTSTDVLVVGAGPTGLTLALALITQGVPCTLVDALPEGANTSRAAVVHARTLEVLEPLKVTDDLVAAGIRARRFTVRDRDRVLMEIGFDHLPTAYPYTLMVPQSTTEAVLLDRFVALGGEVHRPVRLTGLTPVAGTSIGSPPQAVTATFGDGSTVSARWVVGADGMHSTVREQAGIPFDGAPYAESFLLADVVLTDGAPEDQVILFFSPAGLVVLAPLPGGSYRVVATLDEAPERPAVADVQEILDARGPQRPRTLVGEVVWGSRFRVHHRIARRYRQGQVLLAGDAAHVHSPAGGQGMNTGIQDAVALADALAAALAGDGPALDRYALVRRPVAQQVVGLTDRLTRLATMPAAARPLRNLALSAAAALPPVPHGIARRLAGLVHS